MFQILWNADQHTAADGAYIRALKARKGIYITAAIGIGTDVGWYHEAALTKLLPVLSLPNTALMHAALLSLVYLLFQYALICAQLFETYRLTLDDRLFANKNAEMQELNLQISNTRKQISDLDNDIDQRGMAAAVRDGIVGMKEQRTETLE